MRVFERLRERSRYAALAPAVPAEFETEAERPPVRDNGRPASPASIAPTA